MITRKDLCALPGIHDLPQSIYGAAMMAAARSSHCFQPTVHGVTVCVFAALCLNIFAQFYVLYCTQLYITMPAVSNIRQLYDSFHQHVFLDGAFSSDAWQSFDRAEELCKVPLSQPMLFLSILSVWTGTCWVDLQDSFRFMWLWYQLKRPSSDHWSEFENVEENLVTTAASRATKSVVVAFVLIPKALIAIYLWILGARWLTATTSFESLLLNAVALAFITNLDELIYTTIVPEDIQAIVGLYKLERPCRAIAADAFPDREISLDYETSEYQSLVSENRDRKFSAQIARMLLTTAVIIALPVVYMRYLQQVLPDYHWDVREPCEARLEELMGLEE